MPENIEREDYFDSPLSLPDLMKIQQKEGVTAIPEYQQWTEFQTYTNIAVETKITEISIEALAAQYPYLVILPKDNSTISPLVPEYDLSKWKNPLDFNEYFSNQPFSKDTLSIKEIYPIAVETKITEILSIDSLAAQYPYLIILRKDNNAISLPVSERDLSKRKNLFDFNEYFPNQPFRKDTLSVKETYPEKDTLSIKDTHPKIDTLSIKNTYLKIDTPSIKDTYAKIDTLSIRDTLNLEIDTLSIKETHPEEEIQLEKETYLEIKTYSGKDGTPVHRGIQAEIWFTPMLFLMFVIYGLAFFRKKKILLQDMKEFLTFSSGNETFKKDFSIDNLQSRISLVISGIVNISLFSFFAITRLLNLDIKNFTLILSLLLAITILYALFKTAMIKLICYIFFDKNRSSIWTKTFYSFIRFLGISLIPIVLCLSFGPTMWMIPVIYTGFLFCICLSILYLSKVTTFFFQDASSLFYLILYLCSLEILPALIFLKELINIITMV